MARTKKKLAAIKGRLSHVSADGTAHMVNVETKPDVFRSATATSKVEMATATIRALRQQALPKGDVLTVARIAGIQAAKRTAELIPLCHPLPLNHVDVRLRVRAKVVEIEAEARTVGKTGVEMEALTAASVTALTIYDMCKAVDKKMVIGPTTLASKTKSLKPESS